MKAVIYHADGPIAQTFEPGIYEKLFQGFRESAKQWGIETVHLTLDGCPGWGDQNFYIHGDPVDIVYNREIAWLEFLKQADSNEIYWFTEPDSRIHSMWPPLTTDVALTRRCGDPVAICPAWRMATTQSIPLFEEVIDNFDINQKTWHGDSVAFIKLWRNMGQPNIETINYKGLTVELRNYKQYLMPKSMYSRQFKDRKKLKLLEQESIKEQ